MPLILMFFVPGLAIGAVEWMAIQALIGDASSVWLIGFLPLIGHLWLTYDVWGPYKHRAPDSGLLGFVWLFGSAGAFVGFITTMLFVWLNLSISFG